MPAYSALAIDERAHGGARLAAAVGVNTRVTEGPLASLMRLRALRPVFQPIASLRDGKVYGHEALIRGPQASSFEFPDVLLLAAAQEGLGYEFELACATVQLQQWGGLRDPGRLFVNMSAEVLVRLMKDRGRDALIELMQGFGVAPRMLVLEITEHERVIDMDQLARVADEVHLAGAALALDDFGDGRSSLRLWSQIRPDIVKIDKYFTANLSQGANKLKTVQALQQIASIFDTSLVAEGIESADDLRVLRDLGIPYGQGYFLGRPESQARTEVLQPALQVMRDTRVAVLPQSGRGLQTGYLRGVAVLIAPTLHADSSTEEAASLFHAKPELHALAVLDGQRPIALISRAAFMNEYTKPYYREIWGRKSCMRTANCKPRLIERDHNVDELVGILTSEDQRYLTEGFVVVENGRYVGLGTGDQLVRSVTEVRIEAARHANPLTFLPGNIPISQHIDRLLAAGTEFVACYADLNNFKPFNDQYGYWRGDEMIRLLARLSLSHRDPLRDFVGHVGGDDFILLYQSANWRAQCLDLISTFAKEALKLFDEKAVLAGGITAEDRHGVTRFFACTTLSIGAVPIGPSEFTSAEQVASLAALAKHDAKLSGSGLCVRREKAPVGALAGSHCTAQAGSCA